MKKLILTAAFIALIPQIANAKRIVISTDSKVFETPVAKDEYCAVNDNDEPVILLTGMAFQVKEEKAGWYVIEYSPGLRGMVMTNVISDNNTISAPVQGNYSVTNNPGEKVEITVSGTDYTLKSGQKSYKGNIEDKVVLFVDAEGKKAYSATMLDKKPAIFNYNNAITKFF